ncbi:MAG: heparin lyase I family protein [Bdellovibrionota bacterium]
MASRGVRALYLVGEIGLTLGICACGSVLPFMIPASDSNSTDSLPSKDTVTFSADWSVDAMKGGWSTLQAVRGSSIAANSTTWHGLTSARVEVRPGDDPLGTTGERAEVAVMKNRGKPSFENAASGTVYFAVSYKLPTDWRANTSGWSIVFALQGPDSLAYSPALALNADDAYSLTIHAGDLRSNTAPGSFHDLAFSDPNLNLGKWSDFIIGVVFSPTASGSVTVWRRNEGQASFVRVAEVTGIATLQYNGAVSAIVEDHYWKQGLFRSDASFTNVLWMGPTARGGSFKSVERTAFGTATGMP